MRDAPGDFRMIWASGEAGGYPAYVGEGLIRSGFPALEGRSFIVTDRNVGPRYAELFPSEGELQLDPGETEKTLETAERVWTRLVDAGMTRHDNLIALGGGVVGDVAGFCAATYQRGMPVLQVPTTLVAQVDSAYGGKDRRRPPSGEELHRGLPRAAGGRHRPVDARSTLPAEEMSAGFVEVVKTALIAGGSLWERVRGLGDLDYAALEALTLIFDCAPDKIEVVASDERDSGRRAMLNLGHTVGHAIEAETGYHRYRHGEAVALGLLAALRLSGADELRSEVSDSLARQGVRWSSTPRRYRRGHRGDGPRQEDDAARGSASSCWSAPGEPRWGERVEPDRVRAAVEELKVMTLGNRVEVLHGANFDMLGARDRLIYGGLSLSELEAQVKGWATRSGAWRRRFFQSNHEGEFVEYLHRLPEIGHSGDRQCGRLDPLPLRDSRRARPDRYPDGRGPPFRHPTPARSGDAFGVRRSRLVIGKVYGKRPGRLPRRARAARREARSP